MSFNVSSRLQVTCEWRRVSAVSTLSTKVHLPRGSLASGQQRGPQAAWLNLQGSRRVSAGTSSTATVLPHLPGSSSLWKQMLLLSRPIRGRLAASSGEEPVSGAMTVREGRGSGRQILAVQLYHRLIKIDIIHLFAVFAI